MLDLLKQIHYLSSRIKVNNLAEYISKSPDSESYFNNLKHDCSRSQTPTDNAYKESFNGSFTIKTRGALYAPLVFIATYL